MLRNIIITTLRFFIKHKAYSVTNALGLSLGLATCILIFLFVQDETSYDRFHDRAGQIYRLEPYFLGDGEESHWAASQGNLLPAFISRYPEVQSGVKFHKSFGVSVFRNGDKIFREDGVLFADSTFFEVFSFKMIQGDDRKALAGPGKIVLTESTARKYFGQENALGKTLVTDQRSYMVSGIIRDVPTASHLKFNLLVSLDDLRASWPNADQAGPSTFYSYIRLHDNASLDQLKEKVEQDIWSIYGYTVSGDSANIPEGYSANIIFQPITSIHLQGHAEKELEANSDKQYVFIFSAVALFVLIIACINYMNLATARSATRGKEIGVKKVLGANRKGIFIQFIGESFFMSLIAMVVAVLLVNFILPYFNQVVGKSLELSILDNLPLALSLLVIWVLVSVMAGSYPALYLSGFNPLKVLYSSVGYSGKAKSTLNFRRGLVIFQFAISILLIIGSLTIYKQINFIQHRELGFKKDHVIVVPLAGANDNQKVEVLKNALLTDPSIVSASGSSSIPGMRMHFLTFRLPDQIQENLEGNNEGEDVLGVRTLSSDIDIVRTFGLEVVEGREFSRDWPNDPEQGFILNQAAVAELGIENPVGARIEYLYNLPEPKKGHIIGVVKDFHYASLHSKVEPLIIHIFPNYNRYLSIRVQSEDMAHTLKVIEEKWLEVFASVPFDYYFLDTYYDNLYRTEMNMSSIITYFTLLAIIIACLGLFGLASFITEQKTKEIGIRKVLGSSTREIISLTSKEFVILIVLSNIIAWGPAWYFMNKWLEGFVVSTSLNWWLFLLSAVISLLVSLSIVGIQSYRAAQKDPVKAISA